VAAPVVRVRLLPLVALGLERRDLLLEPLDRVVVVGEDRVRELPLDPVRSLLVMLRLLRLVDARPHPRLHPGLIATRATLGVVTDEDRLAERDPVRDPRDAVVSRA
jgi:hypothetical protein